MNVLKGSLVLEGGGMRGIYTAGVLDYFMERDIYFQNCIGVSAGANHGSNYLSGQKGRSLKIVLKYLQEKQYASMQARMITGNFFDKKFHTRILPDILVPYHYQKANTSPMHFYAVATQCESGKAVYKRISNTRRDREWIWASGCLPLFAKATKINGYHYLDGAVADAIPVRFAQSLGSAKTVAVLTRDASYRKKKEHIMPVIKARYHMYPKLVQDMKTRAERYNETLDYIKKQEFTRNLFVIQPQKPVTIGRLEKDKEALQALYEEGYQDAKNNFEAMLDYMEDRVDESANR